MDDDDDDDDEGGIVVPSWSGGLHYLRFTQ